MITIVNEVIKLEEELSIRFPNPKLSLCLIPRTCVGSNLRSLLSTDDWDKLRRAEYLRANYTCEICEKNKTNAPIHCHEEWEFDIETMTQNLTALIVLCELCHALKHPNSAREHLGKKKFDLIKAHLQNINNWTDDELYNYTRIQYELNDLRGILYHWRMNVSYIYDRDVTIDWSKEDGHRRPKGKILQINFKEI